MKIEKPGLYFDVSAADYHADPCPEPSFTQSIAKVLLAQSPAHAQVEHPRLRPPPSDDDEAEKYVKARAIGDAAHLLMLGRGKRLAILSFDNFRKNEAKLQRDEAVWRGELPILEKHYQCALDMNGAAQMQLNQYKIDGRNLNTILDTFEGDSEVVIVWQEDELWARAMIDYLTADRRIIIDYKTTGLSVAPTAIGKLMGDAGWPIQAAMHELGLTTLDPDCAGRLSHIFIAQEQYPPYELTVSQLPESTMTFGRKLLARAWGKWRAAMQAGRWDGYPRVIQSPVYPPYLENKILAEEIAEADAADAGYRNVLMAG